jgi:hypothetical protein
MRSAAVITLTTVIAITAACGETRTITNTSRATVERTTTVTTTPEASVGA